MHMIKIVYRVLQISYYTITYQWTYEVSASRKLFLYYIFFILISYVISVCSWVFIVGRATAACDFSFFSNFEFSPELYSTKSAKIHIHMWMGMQTDKPKLKSHQKCAVCLCTLIKFSKRRQLWLNRNIIMTLTIASCQ